MSQQPSNSESSATPHGDLPESPGDFFMEKLRADLVAAAGRLINEQQLRARLQNRQTVCRNHKKVTLTPTEDEQ